MNKTEESDKRWEGGGKICLKAYQKSGVTVILFTVRGYSKLKRPIESSTVGAAELPLQFRPLRFHPVLSG